MIQHQPIVDAHELADEIDRCALHRILPTFEQLTRWASAADQLAHESRYDADD